ncbi:MAG: glycosyltransferase family 2 protein [Phycisphaerales bacterium]
MTLPTVSIVVPSYNQARYLRESIESLINQRDQIHELIVMDGGSTDESASIIQQYESELTHWQSAPDKGQSDAIIQGFERSSGDILTWINSDDAMIPGAILDMREAFASNPSIGFIEGNTVIIDQDSTVLRCEHRAGPSRRWAKLGYMRIHQPSTMFRRSLYEEVGGIDRSLHCTMDTDLWYRMFRVSDSMRLDRYTGVHRIHTDAKGEHDSWKEQYAKERTILDQRYSEFRNNPIRYQLGRIALIGSKLVNTRSKIVRVNSSNFAGKKLNTVSTELGIAAPSR